MAQHARFTSAARKANALKKLGISPDELASAPKITPLLRSITGGPKDALRVMRFSQDSTVQSFLTKYDSLGVWERRNTPWEAIGLSAGVDLLHLLAAVLIAVRKLHLITGNMVVLANHAEVLRKTIECAKHKGGWRDRAAVQKLFLAFAGSDARDFQF